METLPTKELLSAVLGTNDYRIRMMCKARSVTCRGTVLYIPTTYGSSSINIYELMHMMKEWSADKFLPIMSEHSRSWTTTDIVIKGVIQRKLLERYSKAYIGLNLYLDEFGRPYSRATFDNEPFTAPTEPEAVTKACEWVLEHTKGGE